MVKKVNTRSPNFGEKLRKLIPGEKSWPDLNIKGGGVLTLIARYSRSVNFCREYLFLFHILEFCAPQVRSIGYSGILGASGKKHRIFWDFGRLRKEA